MANPVVNLCKNTTNMSVSLTDCHRNVKIMVQKTQKTDRRKCDELDPI